MTDDIIIKLSKFFDTMWGMFIDGATMDGADLQDILDKSGLTSWYEATDDDVKDTDYEVGDMLMGLNAEGREVIECARSE
jgi:hypothetical protein